MLQDKAQPETQARAFGSVSFNALLAVDDPEALSLVRQPGSDGFRLDSTPLFQVKATVKTLPWAVNMCTDASEEKPFNNDFMLVCLSWQSICGHSYVLCDLCAVLSED